MRPKVPTTKNPVKVRRHKHSSYGNFADSLGSVSRISPTTSRSIEERDEILENTEAAKAGAVFTLLTKEQAKIIDKLKQMDVMKYAIDLLSSEFLVVNGYFERGNGQYIPTQKLKKVLDDVD